MSAGKCAILCSCFETADSFGVIWCLSSTLMHLKESAYLEYRAPSKKPQKIMKLIHSRKNSTANWINRLDVITKSFVYKSPQMYKKKKSY